MSEHERFMREAIAEAAKGKAAGNPAFGAVIVEDGVNAIEVLEANNNDVDVIITDLNMPNMDGLQLVRELRAKPEFKGTPILFLTTRNSDADKAQGRAAGATGWIAKPFDPQKLVQVVNKVCP